MLSPLLQNTNVREETAENLNIFADKRGGKLNISADNKTSKIIQVLVILTTDTFGEVMHRADKGCLLVGTRQSEPKQRVQGTHKSGVCRTIRRYKKW